MIFNYCSIPIYIIILCTTFLRKTTKRLPNRLFIVIISVSLFTALIELVADGYAKYLPLSQTMRLCVSAANYAYFVTRNAIALLYLIFLLSLLRTGFHFRTVLSKVLLLFPYACVLAVLCTNPLHHKAFVVTSEEGYVRGALLSVFYAASLLYSVVGTVHLICCIKLLRAGNWIALMSMYVLSFIGIFIQLFYPQVLIEIFITAIAFLLVVLVVLRPEEITDSSVGLPSWKAYCDELYKITHVHQPVLINVVRFINASQVREYLGETRYNLYIMQLAATLENHSRRNKIAMDLYYEAPDAFYFVLSDLRYRDMLSATFSDVIAELRLATRDIEESGVYLIPRMCSIQYPNDVGSMGEIVQIGHSFSSLLADNQLHINASELVGTRRYQIEANIGTILGRAITGSRFEMHYQPIYRMRDGRFSAAEALIRLHDSYFGNIPPAVFIPDAEKNGLIVSVGDFVLESVYRFISEHDLRELGLDYIEINLSLAQCFQVDLPQKIHLLQRKYNVHPSCVNFEITETTYSDISSVVEENIAALVAEGYSFSLDDYGTGYSNMQRIVKLPLSLIKLDKSLIDEMTISAGCSVVRNTIKMMQDIDKHVLAEGVETERQFEMLKEMQCDFIQGYYFSTPLAVNDFVSFLKERRQR